MSRPILELKNDHHRELPLSRVMVCFCFNNIAMEFWRTYINVILQSQTCQCHLKLGSSSAGSLGTNGQFVTYLKTDDEDS